MTFHYKSDASGTPQFGLIAEEVAEVNPDLVVRDENGEICTVLYDAVNAMLLNEFLKKHHRVEEQSRKIQEQEATIMQLKSDAAKQEVTINQLKKGMGVLTAQLREQAARCRISLPAGAMRSALSGTNLGKRERLRLLLPLEQCPPRANQRNLIINIFNCTAIKSLIFSDSRGDNKKSNWTRQPLDFLLPGARSTVVSRSDAATRGR